MSDQYSLLLDTLSWDIRVLSDTCCIATPLIRGQFLIWRTLGCSHVVPVAQIRLCLRNCESLEEDLVQPSNNWIIVMRLKCWEELNWFHMFFQTNSCYLPSRTEPRWQLKSAGFLLGFWCKWAGLKAALLNHYCGFCDLHLIFKDQFVIESSLDVLSVDRLRIGDSTCEGFLQL